MGWTQSRMGRRALKLICYVVLASRRWMAEKEWESWMMNRESGGIKEKRRDDTETLSALRRRRETIQGRIAELQLAEIRSGNVRERRTGAGELTARGTRQRGWAIQIWAMPPSTNSSMPVMKLLSSEARKETALAISSEVPRRPMGTALTMAALNWAVCSALARILRSLRSRVQLRAKERRAAFVAL